MVKGLSWKKGDLEIRTTEGANGESFSELIKWDTNPEGRNYCYVLAYFRKDSDGYVNLVFVGDRPFRHIAEIDINSVWKELFLTQLLLEGEEEE